MAFAPRFRQCGFGNAAALCRLEEFRAAGFCRQTDFSYRRRIKGGCRRSASTRFFAVDNGGVICSLELIVNVSRGKMLYLAFDSDFSENPAVARQIAEIAVR